MTKEEIINKLKKHLTYKVKSKNSMGVSEQFYDAYYLVAMCFTKNKQIKIEDSQLNKLNKEELERLIYLATYASQVFF